MNILQELLLDTTTDTPIFIGILILAFVIGWGINGLEERLKNIEDKIDKR